MTEEEFYNVLIIYKNRFDALSKKENKSNMYAYLKII